MKRFGLILILIIAAFGAWAGWTYATTEHTVREIAVRLPAEDTLNGMPLEQTGETVKLAVNECARVARLEANPLARLLRGDEIKSLAEHCELIKARQDALDGP
jgi:hypothetical protein